MNIMKMVKKQIGILTFWYAVNPGSALQAYSLWKTINSLSPEIECNLINYQSTYYRSLFLKFPFKLSIIQIIAFFFFSHWYYRYQRFWKGIPLAVKPQRRMDEKKLKSIEGYDCIVVGSDQVWNTELTNKNFNFFLPFISGIKKVSFAASIGLHDFPEEDKDAIKGFLKDFSCISVREAAAQDAVERLIGVRPQLMMDPSLLLNKEQYESITEHPSIKKKYILLYLRHKDSKITPYAKKMADTLGLQLVECHDRIKKISNDNIIIRYPDPKRWMGLIRDAEYIFTDSFHGCAFCINFNKPFYVMISSANSEMSSRIYNILDRYKMTDRLITEKSDLMAMRDMSFEYSNSMLEQDRETAINYLKSALNLNE